MQDFGYLTTGRIMFMQEENESRKQYVKDLFQAYKEQRFIVEQMKEQISQRFSSEVANEIYQNALGELEKKQNQDNEKNDLLEKLIVEKG